MNLFNANILKKVSENFPDKIPEIHKNILEDWVGGRRLDLLNICHRYVVFSIYY